ncbi:MAG: alpha/beta fold hydrolase [Acidimicrobiales bacterium]
MPIFVADTNRDVAPTSTGSFGSTMHFTPATEFPASRHIEASGFADTEDGVRVAFYDFGGDGAPLLLVHATGFCAAVLSPLASALRERFHCFALDLRAHGASGRPADGDLEWHGFARDVAAVIDTLALESPFGFGHSCGGAALLLAEQAAHGTFEALHCYEPVVLPLDTPLDTPLDMPLDTPPAPGPGANPMSAGALRRRSSFGSREEGMLNFSTKAPLNRLRPDVLASYVDNAFGPGRNGKIHLLCRREDEAAIYAQSFTHDAYQRLDEVGCFVTLSCGEQSDDFGPEVLARLAERVVRSRVVVMPELGHFGPLEDPEAIAESMFEDGWSEAQAQLEGEQAEGGRRAPGGD